MLAMSPSVLWRTESLQWGFRSDHRKIQAARQKPPAWNERRSRGRAGPAAEKPGIGREQCMLAYSCQQAYESGVVAPGQRAGSRPSPLAYPK